MEYLLVAGWVVAFAALAAAGYPIAARLFPRFPSRGAGLALPTALAVVTTAVYWLGHLTFGPAVVAAGVAALVAVAAVAALDPTALRDRRLALGISVGDRRATLDAAAVFAVAFLFVIALRAVDPAVHAGGGEKFLDFGLLRSLLRASALPPKDMWFAGEPVRYYYGGHLMAAVLATLTATPARFAYNLALAGFYAMLVTAAFDLAGAIAAGAGHDRRLAGAVAAFFVGFASNLLTAVNGVVGLLPARVRRDVADAVADRFADHSADTVFENVGLAEFNYWTASRVIPGTINEFPLFSWLNGDLHAHMTSTPFLLLGAAICFSYYRTPAADRRRRVGLAFGALPVLGGLQAVVNTWSAPTLFGLLWLATVFAPAPPRSLLPPRVAARLPEPSGGRASAELRRVGGAVAVAVAAGALAAVLAAPFLLSAASGRSVAWVAAADRSGLVGLFLVHGAFVLAFGVYLLDRFDLDRVELAAVVFGWIGVAALAAMGRIAVAAVAVPLVAVGWVVLRSDRTAGFETVLIVAGAGLVTVVEMLYVVERAGPGRFNTVFKTYMQVWVLWGTALGPVAAALVGRPASTADWWPSQRVRRVATAALVAGLVVSTSVYGGLAVAGHFGDDEGYGYDPYPPAEPTLDATAYVEEYHPEAAAAIEWLDARTDDDPDPTLLSAPATSTYPAAESGSYPYPPGMYRFTSSPAASLTGVPTVAGWAHEVGYRGVDPYVARVRAVDAAYDGSAAERVRTLRGYDVEYVWIGEAERARYGDVTFGSLSGVSLAFENDRVRIYRVDGSALPSAAAAEAGTETETATSRNAAAVRARAGVVGA